MIDLQWFYLLPLLSVFVGLALYVWHNHVNSPFSSSRHRVVSVLRLRRPANSGLMVQPILLIIRTVRRKLLQVDDDKAPSFVLLS
ncbi:hypothetical protein [Alicyclobacillus sp. SO9]|uniref:hypothetical protein n=1 Tax=Alicyclobacillus sp. SO9 TaxID=2665646 RepID=UPI0018E89A61|nr:hypothetical protein [Alicyclobacillus sp. SO9]QQE79234.1 hypothetical protein GI364_01600 [Alicyclobacillus sp. SO9]